MPFEGRQRAAALDRCWSIYLSLTSVFILPENFHVEFPIVAESVPITGALQVPVTNHEPEPRTRPFSDP